jgi:hypothetical protein
MRKTLTSILLTSAIGLSGLIVAQDSQNLKRPLDLPSGGKGDEEEEEDIPESITFYGGEYEGDGFFWCLDKSCSMGWSGEIQTLKQEMNSAINQMSHRSEFSVVAYSDNYTTWSTVPKKANHGNKSSALAYVNSLQAAGGTCIAPGTVKTIEIANLCGKRKRNVIMLGDGYPECGGETSASVLSDITSANYQRIPISTVYISGDSDGITLFQQIAAMNNGTFRRVQ